MEMNNTTSTAILTTEEIDALARLATMDHEDLSNTTAKPEHLQGFTFNFLKAQGLHIKAGSKAFYKSITFIKDKKTNKTYPKTYHLFKLEDTKEMDALPAEDLKIKYIEFTNRFLTSKALFG